MWALCVIVGEVSVDPVLYPVKFFFVEMGVAQALFSENAIEAFNEGLFVLLVWSCGSDAGNVLLRMIMPCSFELRAAVTLNVVDMAKGCELLFEGDFAVS